MKKLLILLAFTVATSLNAQGGDYNTKGGYAAEGYDVVSYFNNKALKGNSKYATTYDNVKYKFATQANLDTFKADPQKYMPAYGGYCAYAVAVSAKKVSVDPETFEIRNGRLYLFYNSWGNNTLKSWLKEKPTELVKTADRNWEKITN